MGSKQSITVPPQGMRQEFGSAGADYLAKGVGKIDPPLRPEGTENIPLGFQVSDLCF